MRDANYKLVQEEYEGDAWKIIVCSILLNRTRGEQVKGVVRAFFRRWPDARSLVRASVETISEEIRPLGLYNTRAKYLLELSRRWVSIYPPSIHQIVHLPGVGEYALASYAIFVLGLTGTETNDGVLRHFLSRKPTMITLNTHDQLIEFIGKLTGPTRAVLKSKTSVKLNKKDVETKSIPNPHGDVFKIQEIEVELNAKYEDAVNNARLMEGKEQDFAAGSARWGEFLNNSVLRKDDGLYVKVIEIGKVGSPTYITADGEILPEDAIAPFMPNKKGSVKQDLEDQVKVKMFKVSSIREMRVGTKVKYVAPPPNVGAGVTM